MARSRYFSAAFGWVMFAAFGLASTGSPARAQSGGMSARGKVNASVAAPVYQRDVNGKGEIPVNLGEEARNGQLIEANVNGINLVNQGVKLVDGKLVGVPAGGPYTINFRFKHGQRWRRRVSRSGFCG